MNKSCANCEFYSQFDDDDQLGSCYRFPPVFVRLINGRSSDQDSWDLPTVSGFGWCGEFKAEIVGASSPVAIEKRL